MKKQVYILSLLYFWHCILFSFTVSFVSPQIKNFYSHFNRLKFVALELKKYHPEIDIHFIFAHFNNSIIHTDEYRKEVTLLKNNNIHIQTCAKDPDQIIQLVQDTNLIIFDFFIYEAEIASRFLHIPSICSINLVLDENHLQNYCIHNHMYNLEKKYEMKRLYDLEKKYNLDIVSQLEQAANVLFLPSAHVNVINAYPLFAQAIDFLKNRNLHTVQYAINPLPNIAHLQNRIPKKPGQKLIYVSFGTNEYETFHAFKNTIYTWLIDNFANHEEYIFIIANTQSSAFTPSHLPKNFILYKEQAPQVEILHQVDLFITHAGANSVAESIALQVPIIAIPLAFDQHTIAATIENLCIGISFLHNSENAQNAIFLKNAISNRDSLSEQKLCKSIIHILNNAKMYKENILKIKTIPCLDFIEIIKEYIS